jgi:hypothetical protein
MVAVILLPVMHHNPVQKDLLEAAVVTTAVIHPQHPHKVNHSNGKRDS